MVDFLTAYTNFWDASDQGKATVYLSQESITIGNLFSGLERESAGKFF
jgi:hypothetical protein